MTILVMLLLYLFQQAVILVLIPTSVLPEVPALQLQGVRFTLVQMYGFRQ
jgi:hypothetical protein